MSDFEEEPSTAAVEAMETLPRFTALRSLTIDDVQSARNGPSSASRVVVLGLDISQPGMGRLVHFGVSARDDWFFDQSRTDASKRWKPTWLEAQ